MVADLAIRQLIKPITRSTGAFLVINSLHLKTN